MATRKQLSGFLVSAMPKALYQAMLVLPDRQAAQQVLTRAMLLTITRHGAARPELLALLFQRTLTQACRRPARLWRQAARLDADAPILLEMLATPAPESHWPASSEAPALIHAALALLPDADRQAYLLRHWLGFSPQQAAQSMALSSRTLARHEHNGRHALHTLLSLKGLSLPAGYASLDAAICAVLTAALPKDEVQLPDPCLAALDAAEHHASRRFARLRPWLALNLHPLRRATFTLLLAVLISASLPQLPWQTRTDTMDDTALLADSWPLDTLLDPALEQSHD
ncbi:sigma factor-like helix-turn-helix DNA-binding protein [Craterilacuibacter sinensis]|uniref:RNA polymerase sigma factor 70 region 4 type 2 domain-containing protein n=1 Tax=Craterilacuibacter sinensis TaxID=2686017 RepID=A0A845BLG4_9NEIS|nr:sigma factor-like helix-turn-helix DNA-binding protein [Craterilacuibacter sinensis]MXR36068.1 hypothetical protein [Craterilacuibacter sinensis]